jgi:Protein of Unknown function (DUF2784)
MGWWLLAALVVLVHLAFTGFVVFGGFLTWRWRPVIFAHIPALGWGCWIEISGRICPLTPLENRLRHLAGDAGYSGGFLEHYVLPVLYPPGLTRNVQWMLAGLLVAINVVAYVTPLRRKR